MRDMSFCTTFASLSYFASGTFGRLLITTHRSKVSSMGGYRGCGSRGASEKYPSRDAASSARSSAAEDEELGAMIGLLLEYVSSLTAA